MLILVGEAGSGKDTIANLLVKDFGYKKLVRYTSRPKREDEVDGITYNFITGEEFEEKVKEGFFAEYEKFTMVTGCVMYGSSREDIANADNKTLMICARSGLEQLLESGCFKGPIVYLTASEDVRRNRQLNRGDNEAEVVRRLSADEIDFRGIQKIITYILANNGDKAPYDVAKMVDYMCRAARSA